MPVLHCERCHHEIESGKEDWARCNWCEGDMHPLLENKLSKHPTQCEECGWLKEQCVCEREEFDTADTLKCCPRCAGLSLDGNCKHCDSDVKVLGNKLLKQLSKPLNIDIGLTMTGDYYCGKCGYVTDNKQCAESHYSSSLLVYRIITDEPQGVCVGFEPDNVSYDTFCLGEDNGGDFVHIIDGIVFINKIQHKAEPNLMIWRNVDEYDKWLEEFDTKESIMSETIYVVLSESGCVEEDFGGYANPVVTIERAYKTRKEAEKWIEDERIKRDDKFIKVVKDVFDKYNKDQDGNPLFGKTYEEALEYTRNNSSKYHNNRTIHEYMMGYACGSYWEDMPEFQGVAYHHMYYSGYKIKEITLY